MRRLRMTLVWCHAIAVVLACEGASAASGSALRAFSTLLGAGGWERAQAVWLDASGNIYLCGSTQSPSFPVTAGAYDVTHNDTGQGGSDVNDGWVAKLSPDGTQLLWATFLGGSRRDDCYGIRTDSGGNVFVAGWTASSDFPTTAGAYDRTHNGSMDIFVAKLNPQGTQLLSSTLIGGGGIDQCRGAMAVDSAGAVYFAGYTDSINYPTTAGAVQTGFQGGYGDALVGRVSADFSSLEYSTYLGSSGPDNAFSGVHLHADGSLSIVGLAGGANFPVTAGVYQPTYGGDSGGLWFGDAFVSRMTIGAGSATVHFTTFLGGNGNDFSFGQNAMTADSEGTYVFASTNSTNLPTSTGAYQTTLNGSFNLYLAKISYDGTALLAGTYIGGNVGGYEPSGTELGPSGRPILSGSIFGATSGHPVTADAVQPTAGGLDEGFFMILSQDFSSLDYSTFVGGSGKDRVRDVAVDATGRAVVTGDTRSTDFPTTTGAYQPLHAGETDAHFVAYDVSQSASTASINGCLELGREPMSGERVVFKQTGSKRRRTETGKEGCFAVAPVYPGRRLRLGVWGPEVESDGEELSARFALGESALRNARLILLHRPSGSIIAKRRTDAAGYALFDELAAGDRFKLDLRIKRPKW